MGEPIKGRKEVRGNNLKIELYTREPVKIKEEVKDKRPIKTEIAEKT